MSRIGYLLKSLAVAVMLVVAADVAAAPTRNWERVSSAVTEVAEADSMEAVDVRVSDGYVYICVLQPTPVKVFTILGQLVTKQNLEAGVWRLPLSARGIYILKVGSQTRRITI